MKHGGVEPYFTNPKHTLVAVVLALDRGGGKPSRVGAVIIHHVIRPHPHKLVALVEVELQHGRRIPPVPLLGAAAALLLDVGSGHLGDRARVDLEALVGCDEGGVGPVRLHKPTLRGPIISIPN